MGGYASIYRQENSGGYALTCPRNVAPPSIRGSVLTPRIPTSPPGRRVAMPQNPCRYPGCPNFVPKGAASPYYCAAHQHVQKEMDAMRGNSSVRGYDSKWSKLSRMYLLEHPFCEVCGQPAVLVHHRWASGEERTREKMYEVSRLQALCRKCHAKIHSAK